MIRTFFSIPFTATVVLLAGTIIVSGVTERRIPETLAVPLSGIEPEISGWKVAGEQKLSAGVLSRLIPTEYLSRTYRKGSSELDLFIAFYAQQRAGESMHSPKHCLPGAGWEIWRHDSEWVPVDGTRLKVNKYSVENMGGRMLMFYWYQSKDRVFANEYLGKFLLARDTLLTGRTGGSIVRIMLADTPQGHAEGAAFAREIIPRVKRCFGSGTPLNGE
jgi:EpsI family protein